eukprot:1441791-Amphidinium_carterae.1
MRVIGSSACKAFHDADCVYAYETIDMVQFLDCEASCDLHMAVPSPTTFLCCEDFLMGSDTKTVHEKYRVQCGGAASLKVCT